MNDSPAILEGEVPLESVLSTAELILRPSRPPDYETENRALVAITQHMIRSPGTTLQKLVEVALEVCGAGSAGVSLLSEETGDFYWPAIAGAWKPHIGGGTPRHFGPCGVVLDRNAMQLFTRPERYYPYLLPVSPPITEALLTPFHADGNAAGTVWVVAHDAGRKFDAEDVRLIESLGHLAAAAYSMNEALGTEEQQSRSLREMNEALLVSSVRQHDLIEQAQKAEKTSRESEEGFRPFFDNVEDYGLFQVDPEGRISSWNTGAERIFGHSKAEILGHPVELLLAPEDAEQATRELEVTLRTGHLEDERWLVRKDKTSFFARRVIHPIRDENGMLRGFATVLRDETERRENELRALTAQLMTAQQEEQRRIARELHDSFAQELALLEMDIHLLRETSLHDATALKLGELQTRIGSLSHEVRELSHRLHPSVLEDLGLAAALRSLVDDFQQSHGLDVLLRMEEFASTVPLPLATAFYRIAQEALRNVVKHGGEDALVNIILSSEPGIFRLVIQDTGRGFDPRTVRTSGGLGMLSMQERARQVGGSMEMETALGQGTTLTVVVPAPDVVH